MGPPSGCIFRDWQLPANVSELCAPSTVVGSPGAMKMVKIPVPKQFLTKGGRESGTTPYLIKPPDSIWEKARTHPVFEASKE